MADACHTAEIDTSTAAFLPRRQAALLLALFAAAVGAWTVLAILLPHDRYIRYQQLTDSDLFNSRWVYERIHFDKTPIDVAIIGSSRVGAAVSAPVLERELSAKFHRPIHVANLAIPEEGRNLHYLVTRELLESHPETKIILVSVVEQADLSHYAFRYLADARDILGGPLVINHYYFLDAAYLPYRQMSYFMQTLFPAWFGVSRTPRKDYFGTGFDTTESFYLPSGKLVDRSSIMSEVKLEAGSRKLIAEDGGQWHPASQWHELNYPLERAYTRKLAQVARNHGVETVFVRLPFYQALPGMYDAAFYREFGPLLDAQQLCCDPRLFMDTGHFNRYGTAKVSPWLWTSLSPFLAPLEHGPEPGGN
jgi:hypothetical protein